MNELIETFTEDGEPTGLVSRDAVHRSGLWHRAAHVFLFRSDGRLVIQRRHENKDICPGRWDLSVGEHLQPGEDFAAGAARGLHEELGIEGVTLEAIGEPTRMQLEFPELGIHDCEMQACFFARSDAPVSAQQSEVAEVREIRLEYLAREIASSPESFTPWFLEQLAATQLFDRQAELEQRDRP